MPVELICDQEDCENRIKDKKGCYQVIKGKAIVDMDSSIIQQNSYPGMFCSKECLIKELSCSCQSFEDGCSDCMNGLRVKTK